MKAFLFTHWLPEQKMHALDIMEIFSLEISQISSILLRQAFATKQHAFLSTSTPFYCILVRACTEIKLSRYCSFWTRKWPTWTSLGFLFFFCAFPVSPFLIFLLQWLVFCCACFQFKNFLESIIKTRNFYYGAIKCSLRSLSIKICDQFRAYFGLHLADHGDRLWSLWVS